MQVTFGKVKQSTNFYCASRTTNRLLRNARLPLGLDGLLTCAKLFIRVGFLLVEDFRLLSCVVSD